MKIGIFDSGLGGLIIAKSIRKLMPEYDYVYYGDTKRVPYGNKSHKSVYEFTKEAVDYLFQKEHCAIVIIACNTASARALRKIQEDYAGSTRKVLGVLIPTAEVAAQYQRIGVLATLGTVASDTFGIEIRKLNKSAKVYQNPAPILVPLVEEGDNILAIPFIKKYLQPFLKKKLDALVLGCTHYPILKKEIRKILPKNIKIISQDEIIPKKLKDYFTRHPEISKKLSKNGTVKILTTDQTQNMNKLVKKWFGAVKVTLV
jgi:glutamate racemase